VSKEPDVVTYYNQTHLGYRLFWNLARTYSMHYGLRDDQHRSHVASVLNLIRVLANTVDINERDEVLDVGCGFGGSSLWLAEHLGCRVTGIDINPTEIAFAQRQARERGLEERARFLEMDYREMDKRLEAEAYTVVWQIETLIYADRRAFAFDAFRRLRENGRIVIADYFSRPRAYNRDEERILDGWVQGWAGKDLITGDQFVRHLDDAGFSDIRFENRNEDVWASSRRMAMVSTLTTPLGRCLQTLGIRTPMQTANSRGAVLQYRGIKRGLWVYGIVSGRKAAE